MKGNGKQQISERKFTFNINLLEQSSSSAWRELIMTEYSYDLLHNIHAATLNNPERGVPTDTD